MVKHPKNLWNPKTNEQIKQFPLALKHLNDKNATGQRKTPTKRRKVKVETNNHIFIPSF